MEHHFRTKRIDPEKERVIKVKCPDCSITNVIIAEEEVDARGICECRKCGICFWYEESYEQQ